MKSKFLIGVTGGIGTGKTTFCKIVETLGYPVFYSDVVAKKVIYDVQIQDQIINLLGEKAYVNGVYNVPYVKERVFASAELLQQLNAIIHPIVKSEFENWFETQKSLLCFYESALLYQSPTDKFEKIIEIQSPLEERIARILKRDPERNKEEILKIISNQKFPLDNQKTIVLMNEEKDFFLKKVLKTIEKLLQLKK